MNLLLGCLRLQRGDIVNCLHWLQQQQEEKPEDCIPDKPENQKAREFLAKAPTKGLW